MNIKRDSDGRPVQKAAKTNLDETTQSSLAPIEIT